MHKTTQERDRNNFSALFENIFGKEAIVCHNQVFLPRFLRQGHQNVILDINKSGTVETL